MNYVRRAAGTVSGVASSAASYLPVVGSYFTEAPAPANNTTRLNNPSVTAPAPAPVARVNIPAINVAAAAPAPVAAYGGGSAAAEGTLARIRREKEEREAAARAAANANKAAKRGAFFATNTRKVNYANRNSAEYAKFLTRQPAVLYTPGHQGAAAAYTPHTNSATRAAAYKNEKMGKTNTIVTGVGKGTRRRRATRLHRRAARRS